MTQTQPAPVELPTGGEQLELLPPRNRVERRAIGWWTAGAVIRVALIVGALATGYGLAVSARPWLGPALIVASIAGALYVAVMPTWRYLVHRWETTDEAVYTLTGWFVREWRVAPISRIQTVDRVRGPVQQLLGLATVTVTTASVHGAMRIAGLDADVAARTAQQLTMITQAVPGDAT